MAETAGKCADPDLVLADLLERVTKQIRRGEAVDLAAIRLEYPDHAQRLGEMLPVLEFLVDLSECGADPSARTAPASQTMPPPERENRQGVLGDFRLIREIGCGGMGVVYEVEQISLGRRVALKVLPFAAMLDPRQLARFEHESRAAALLDHPNVVQVYSVGCERGVHYYAMQYVAGRTLSQVIKELRDSSGVRANAENDRATGQARAAEGSGFWLAERQNAGQQTLAPDAPIPGVAVQQANQWITSGSGPAMAKRTRSRRAGRFKYRLSLPPGFFRWAASVGAQAADALEHAHQAGVVHRDIKPSNLIVDPNDHLRVTDFGLAMTSQETHLTVTGDVLGTIQYMSPEQASGQNRVLDHRTDIYSLGTTLYELLTLQPAFTGNDRQEIARQIAEDEPQAPRTLNRAIPRDLETIVLKAMAKEPEKRYRSAGAMAEDLRCFVQDKPVRARRPSYADRMLRWCRRRRALVGLTAVVLLIAATAGPIVAVNQTRLRNQTEQQRRLAAVNLDLALTAVDQMYTQMAERYVRDTPQAELMRLAFLEQARDFYTRFSTENAGDPRLHVELAKAHRRLGDVQSWLGNKPQAEASYQTSIRLYRELAEKDPGHPDYRHELAGARTEFGFLLASRRRHAEAEAEYLGAIQILEGLCLHEPGRPDYDLALAHARNNLGLSYLKRRRYAECEAQLMQALTIKEKLVAESPSDGRYRMMLGYTYHDLGELLDVTKRDKEALEYFQKAIREKSQAIAAAPRNPSNRFQLGYSYQAVAGLLTSIREYDQASAQYRAAIPLFRELSEDYPIISGYHNIYLLSLEGFARSLLRQERIPIGRSRRGRTQEEIRKSEESLQEAIARSEELVSCEPDHQGYRELLFSAHRGYWDLLRSAQRLDEAEVQRQAAEVQATKRVEISAPLLDQAPGNIQLQGEYRNAVVSLGRFQFEAGNAAAAGETLHKGAEILGKLSESHPNFRLPEDLRNLAVALEECGQRGEAIELRLKHVAMLRHSARQEDRYSSELVSAYSTLRELLAEESDLGRLKAIDQEMADYLRNFRSGTLPEGASRESFCNDCLEAAKRLAAQGHTDEAADFYQTVERIYQASGNKNDLAEHYRQTAFFFLQLNRVDEAITSLRQEAAIQDAVATEKTCACANGQSRFRAYYRLGMMLRGTGDKAEGAERLEQAWQLLDNASKIHPEARGESRVFAAFDLVQFAARLEWAGYFEECIATARDALRLAEEVSGQKSHILHYDSVWRWGRIALAKALARTGKLAEARPIFDELVERAPCLGYADLNGFICSDPESVDLKNDLAWFLATAPELSARDPVWAVTLAQEVVDSETVAKTVISAAKGNYWNTLGVARYRAGDLAGAVEALERSIQLRKGGDAFDLFFMAMADWRLGQEQQALQEFEKATCWMDEYQTSNRELSRFRTEAADVLGIAPPRTNGRVAN